MVNASTHFVYVSGSDLCLMDSQFVALSLSTMTRPLRIES